MGKFTVENNCNGIEGLKVLTPQVFGDERGFFMETYNKREFAKLGITTDFVQDNQSSSERGVLRGMHYQIHQPQEKLVRVIAGEVFDVAVDLRKESETYGKWFGIVLSAENKKQLFIPKGFAHGFLVLSETAQFCYKVGAYYAPDDEGGIRFDDPDIDIAWPIPVGMCKDDLKINERDRNWPLLRENNE